MKKYISNNESQTQIIAQEFARTLHGGDIVFLCGDLGAGKTTFTKAVAAELGIEQNITSPTFTLMNLYPLSHHDFCHFDLYRLNDIEELEMLGFEEYFYSSKAICFVEWPQIVNDYITKNKIIVRIEKIDDNSREIIIGDSNEITCD